MYIYSSLEYMVTIETQLLRSQSCDKMEMRVLIWLYIVVAWHVVRNYTGGFHNYTMLIN